MYTFDNSTKNELYVINPSNGALIKTFKNISNKHFNSYKFVDSSLVTEVLGYPSFTYEKFNLSGKYIKQVANEYNVLPSIIPDTIHYDLCVFIGKYNNNYVFWGLVLDKNTEVEKFWLISGEGKVVSIKTLPNDDKLFGKEYYEAFPTEHRKVRNGNLYVLGRKGTNALITEVPLSSFFSMDK